MSAPIQILKRACQVHHFPKQYHFPPTYPLFIRPELAQNNPAGGTVFEQAIICNDSRGGPSSPSCHFFVHNTPFVSISVLYVSSISLRSAAQDWDRKTKQDDRNELDVFPLFPPWQSIDGHMYDEEMRHLSTTKMTTIIGLILSSPCAACMP